MLTIALGILLALFVLALPGIVLALLNNLDAETFAERRQRAKRDAEFYRNYRR